MSTSRSRQTTISLLTLAGLLTVFGCVRAGPGATASTARAPLPPHVDFVEFRWIDTTTPPGATPFVDPASGEPLAVSDSVWLDISGIDSVWVWQRRHAPDTAFTVLLLHSREASAKVGATTATHIGRRTAVLIDGVVAKVFTVCGALGTRSELASYPRRADADSLAARVDRAVRAVRPYRPVEFRGASLRGLAENTASAVAESGRPYPPPPSCSEFGRGE